MFQYIKLIGNSTRLTINREYTIHSSMDDGPQ